MTLERSAPSRRATLGLLAGAPLAACGRAEVRGELKLWAMGREGEVVQSLIPAFQTANPGTTVRVQQLPWSAAHEKLLTAFAGDDLPDLGQVGNTWIPELAAIGAIAPLDARIRASSVVAPTAYFPGVWATNEVGGRQFGIPWYVDTRLLFYRKDILAEAGYAEPPVTWGAWLASMRAIKAKVGPSRYAILLPINEPEPLLALGVQQGEPLITAEGYGNFRSAGFKRALGFYRELFASGLAPAATSSQIANVWSEFARGLFAFYITGPWNIGEFKRRLPPGLAGRWTTAPLPGPNGPGASLAGGSSLAIFSRARDKDAAWRLIEHLSTPESQSRFEALTGDLPPRRDAWTTGTLAGDPYVKAFREQLERLTPAPKIPEWERIVADVTVVGEQLARGVVTVDEAAAELDRRADATLEKRRWMIGRGRAA